MQIPMRLAIVATIFTICGLLAIWSIIAALFEHHLNLNLAAFWLPIGIGLFKGKKSSQKWANFWFILCYISLSAFLIICFISPDNVKSTIGSNIATGVRALPVLFVSYVVAIIITYTMQRALHSQPSVEYFQYKAKRPDDIPRELHNQALE